MKTILISLLLCVAALAQNPEPCKFAKLSNEGLRNETTHLIAQLQDAAKSFEEKLEAAPEEKQDKVRKDLTTQSKPLLDDANCLWAVIATRQDAYTSTAPVFKSFGPEFEMKIANLRQLSRTMANEIPAEKREQPEHDRHR